MEPQKGTNKGGGGPTMRRTFPDGRMYEGQLIKGKMEGEGILIDPNGTMYRGSFQGNKPHGKGVQTWDDGRRFEGVFKEGHAYIGILTSKDGTIYEGEFRGNHPSGHGVKTWKDGARYEGRFQQGKMHGEGSYTWSDGRHHVGQFNHEIAEGQGIYTCTDGRVYRGLFSAGEIVQGVCIWQDGTKYDGIFTRGKATGKGVKTCPDGTVQQGDFKDCVILGRGVELLPDGTMSEGEFEDGNLISGTMIWPDGRRYEGPFDHRAPHGNGTLAFPDGRRYEGHFSGGRFEGAGAFYFPDGRFYDGTFKAGDIDGSEIFVSLNGKWSGYGKATKGSKRTNMTKVQNGNDYGNAIHGLTKTKGSSHYDATKNILGADTVELFSGAASKNLPSRGGREDSPTIASSPKLTGVFSPRPDLQETSIPDTPTSSNAARTPCFSMFNKNTITSGIDSRIDTNDISLGRTSSLGGTRRSLNSEYEPSNSVTTSTELPISEKHMDRETKKLGQRRSLQEGKSVKADRCKSLHEDEETDGSTQEGASSLCWWRKTWSGRNSFERDMGEGVVSKGSNVVTWKKGSTYKDSSKTDQMHGSGALNSGKDYHEAGWLSLTADHEKLLGNLSIVSHMFSPLP